MLITCLARIDGETVGIIANNPLYQAGAMDTNGLDKSTSFLCLCDSFNVPLIFLHDTPGHIDPRKTREYLTKVLAIVRDSAHGGIGSHRLATWPTKF